MTSLYLISPTNINVKSFPFLLEKIFKASTNIGAFQLRLKDQSYQDILSISKVLLKVCSDYNVPFYINDHYNLADDLAIDGIHIGQNDGDIASIIKHYKNHFKIGVSCMNSLGLAIDAKNSGANYVSFGAFFPTKTKENTKHATLDILQSWRALNNDTPCSAIGGINLNNIEKIISFKPEYICLISAIWAQNDPIIAAKQLDDILIRNL
ncbi:MAG: thiamine phosphate synthase, partial [Alphaproteobacteria bacterium]|jgi:thiamine-phosphate pyrophosphorylase|nr:thiamine phosphate synthase [Alphaproteobacteria bacterium]MBT5827690.1 thiamine phosphate synthase [Alphaproteobacteria bacterium]